MRWDSIHSDLFDHFKHWNELDIPMIWSRLSCSLWSSEQIEFLFYAIIALLNQCELRLEASSTQPLGAWWEHTIAVDAKSLSFPLPMRIHRCSSTVHLPSSRHSIYRIHLSHFPSTVQLPSLRHSIDTFVPFPFQWMNNTIGTVVSFVYNKA